MPTSLILLRVPSVLSAGTKCATLRATSPSAWIPWSRPGPVQSAERRQHEEERSDFHFLQLAHYHCVAVITAKYNNINRWRMVCDTNTASFRPILSTIVQTKLIWKESVTHTKIILSRLSTQTYLLWKVTTAEYARAKILYDVRATRKWSQRLSLQQSMRWSQGL